MEFKNAVKTCMVSLTHQAVPHQEWRLDFNRFTKWKRLLTVIGWVKQFIQNSRSSEGEQDVGQLSLAEMADAETQSSHYKENISNRNMKLFKEEVVFQ